jgi:geranylgeranyl diphosphate synthase type II
MDIREALGETQSLINQRIDAYLPEPVGHAGRLLSAMRYASRGGKRVRAFIMLQAAEMFGLDAQAVLPAAIAIELTHAASLVHDDLPCIDDSPLRRGIASCHTEFDEHTALLAGDALFIRAYELFASLDDERIASSSIVRVIGEFAQATGALGLIGGEAADIEAETQEPDADTLQFIHTNKTGRLIAASARTGAILAGAPDGALRTLTEYANHLGLLFQITDDILDETSSEEQLGKPAGADGESEKMTYPALLGLEGAVRRAEQVARMATAAAEELPELVPWVALVELILQRDK